MGVGTRSGGAAHELEGSGLETQGADGALNAGREAQDPVAMEELGDGGGSEAVAAAIKGAGKSPGDCHVKVAAGQKVEDTFAADAATATAPGAGWEGLHALGACAQGASAAAGVAANVKVGDAGESARRLGLVRRYGVVAVAAAGVLPNVKGADASGWLGDRGWGPGVATTLPDAPALAGCMCAESSCPGSIGRVADWLP